jgi:hypothetical protein
MAGLKVEKWVNGAWSEKDGMIDYERELLRQWNLAGNPIQNPDKLFEDVMKVFADKTQTTYQVTFDSGKKVEYDPSGGGGSGTFNVKLNAKQDKAGNAEKRFHMIFPSSIPTDLTYISNVISNVGGSPSNLNIEYMLGVTFLRKCR